MANGGNRPDPPWGFIGIGLVPGLLGGVALSMRAVSDVIPGIALLWAAGVFLTMAAVLAGIGVIGAGVEMGMKRARWRRGSDAP